MVSVDALSWPSGTNPITACFPVGFLFAHWNFRVGPKTITVKLVVSPKKCSKIALSGHFLSLKMVFKHRFERMGIREGRSSARGLAAARSTRTPLAPVHQHLLGYQHIAVREDLLFSHSSLRTPYSSRSSYLPHFSTCCRRVPSWRMPSFCMTRPEAGLRLK